MVNKEGVIEIFPHTYPLAVGPNTLPLQILHLLPFLPSLPSLTTFYITLILANQNLNVMK